MDTISFSKIYHIMGLFFCFFLFFLFFLVFQVSRFSRFSRFLFFTWEHCFRGPCTISFSKIYHIMGLFGVFLLQSYKWDGFGPMGWVGSCVGLLYEHRFAVLINIAK